MPTLRNMSSLNYTLRNISYVMSKGSKVSINPKTFEVRNGKLYLFYNSYGTNRFTKWKKDRTSFKIKADKNWTQLKFKK